jgi:hypothetical protein
MQGLPPGEREADERDHEEARIGEG